MLPDGGETWDTPVKPRADGWVFPGCPHAGPSLKVDAAGAVHIAWWQGKAGEAGVYYGVSTDGAKTFAAQPLAVGERSTPAHVQLALAPGGLVNVAWDDGHSALPGILLRRSSDGGRTFGAPVRISDAGVAATYPVLAAVRDSLCVAWSQMTEGAHREKLAKAVDMKDPKAVMTLPRVGQSEILMRMVVHEQGSGGHCGEKLQARADHGNAVVRRVDRLRGPPCASGSRSGPRAATS